MDQEREKLLADYLQTARQEFDELTASVDTEALNAAATLIRSAERDGKRLHVSGIGKPAHLAGYAASLFSSTGTPAYFLHGTEAVHGSCGQLVEGDVVLFISNSGETAEMRATVLAVKNNGCRLIGMTRDPASWLAKQSDVHLLAQVSQEGGPLNRAPRMSILAETFLVQALSIVLQADVHLTPKQYIKWHPGGKLGELRKEETTC